MTSPVVRRTGADALRELRRLRLEALENTPLAFGSTGVTEPLPHDPSVIEHEMVLVLR